MVSSRFLAALAVVFLMLAVADARAAGGDCLNPLARHLGDACDASLGAAGCCAGDRVAWCEADGVTACFLDCASLDNLACGWDPTYAAYACLPVPSADPSGTHPRECTWECGPDCSDRECGADGCFGSCGTCPADRPACTEEGACAVCVPDCSGRDCGDDGCGGSCGECDAGEVCQADGACCEPDCEDRDCGDDLCGGSCGTCGGDLDCGPEGTCVACSCGDRQCGDDGCGNPCGTCPDGQGCDGEGQCVAAEGGCEARESPGCDGCDCESCVCALDDLCCTLGWDDLCVSLCSDECGGNCPCLPDCRGRACGGDGCGGSCGTCPDGGSCRDGACEAAGCLAAEAPGCDGCACEACVCNLMPECCTVAWTGECAGHCGGHCGGDCECVPRCAGMACGDDGCGGSCGDCAAGRECEDGACVACVPQCVDRACGEDGCGGSCGGCPSGQSCDDGLCRVAFPEGCPGEDVSTGVACPAWMDDAGCCDTNRRVLWCVDEDLRCTDCVARGGADMACGWGGDALPFYRCGGAGEDPSGGTPRACGCVPVCPGRNCGDDGCGGSCGACADGRECREGACRVPDDPDEADGVEVPDHAHPSDLPAEGWGDPGTDAVGDAFRADDGTPPPDGGTGASGGCSASGRSDGTAPVEAILVAAFLLASLARRRRRGRTVPASLAVPAGTWEEWGVRHGDAG